MEELFSNLNEETRNLIQEIASTEVLALKDAARMSPSVFFAKVRDLDKVAADFTAEERDYFFAEIETHLKFEEETAE